MAGRAAVVLRGLGVWAGVWFGLLVPVSAGQIGSPVAAQQEPQGEIIGTIEGPNGGQGLSVKGPMTVQVVGSEVKTLLRSGVDIRVKTGRAKITLVEGGTIAVCGPAHISLLKSGNGLTVALDSGTIHARVEGNLTLNVFTAQILAKTVAIGDGAQDVLVGFDAPGLMCVRAGQGAVHLEEQFGGQSVMVPQGGDITIANGQLQGLKNGSGLCGCDSFEVVKSPAVTNAPELSTLATGEEVKKAAPEKSIAKKESPQPAAPRPAVAKTEPTYQVFMPPLRYDASAKVQDEPDPQMIVLVRRVRVRPTLIFESRVEGDEATVSANRPAATGAAESKKPAAGAAAAPASASVVDRVKSFFKSLWTPSS